MSIKIYPAEANAGLTDALGDNRVSVASCISETNIIQRAQADEYYEEQEKEWESKGLLPGLLKVNAILVTTNWNKNDDVFSPDELWASRLTPTYKPANTDHNNGNGTPNQIVGFIQGSYPVDEQYTDLGHIMAEDAQMPSKFHLMISCLLWEYNFPKIIPSLKSDIAAGKMFVSMECIFNDFGYALQEKGSDDIHLISRNESTAQLTKVLRIFKGKGTVDINGKTYKVGRWLKNIQFVGVAFLHRPANPESIVFTDFVESSKACFINTDDIINENIFDQFDPSCVLSNKREISLWPN